MKYHELEVVSHKNAKRVGRGIAAGQGKTAGRGTKGQKARTGARRKPGFEGGQTPLMQHLPKLHGFRSHKVPAEIVYTGQLEVLKVKAIDNKIIADAGLVSSPYATAKVLVKGEITKAVNVKLQAASVQAIEAIQKAGGSFEPAPRVGRPASTKKQERKAAKAKN